MPPSAISTPSPSGAAVTKLMSMCLFSGWLGAILRRRMKFLALLPPPAFCECRYWPRVSQRNRRLRVFNGSSSTNFTFSPRRWSGLQVAARIGEAARGLQWAEFSMKSWRIPAWQHSSRELSCSLPQPSSAKRMKTGGDLPLGITGEHPAT